MSLQRFIFCLEESFSTKMVQSIRDHLRASNEFLASKNPNYFFMFSFVLGIRSLTYLSKLNWISLISYQQRSREFTLPKQLVTRGSVALRHFPSKWWKKDWPNIQQMIFKNFWPNRKWSIDTFFKVLKRRDL